MRVYISHEYGKRHGATLEEYTANTYKAINYGIEVIRLGHNPFIPNLYHFVSEQAPDLIPESKWLVLVMEWLRFCDALLVCTVPKSADVGVAYEIRLAKAMGLPVYYSLEELRKYDGQMMPLF